MPHNLRAVAAILATLVLVRGAVAETARGLLERREQLDDTTRHWTDREQRMILTIEPVRGASLQRALTIYERHLPGGEQQTVLFFDKPASIRGLGFLSFSHPGRADDQWTYLPALKKVRRIRDTREDREGSFASTDLSYHDLDVLQDMTSWSERDAPATLLGDEVIAGVATHRIELKPSGPDVYYRRIVLWMGKDDLVTRRTELFKEGSRPVKRIEQSDIRTTNGIPVAHRLEAHTVGRGRTVMTVVRVQFNQRLASDLFTQRALERGKPRVRSSAAEGAH